MRHMLDHAREAVAMIRNRARSDLDTNRTFQLAITRLVEIIGEAANRVTVHGRIVWRILTEELPALVAALERDCPGT